MRSAAWIGAATLGLLAGAWQAAAEKNWVPVDLSSRTNAKLGDPCIHGGDGQGNNLAELPRGEQTLQGVKFKVGDGLIHLAGRFAPKRPEKVEGIAVGGRAEALYFLHATGWGQGEPGADTYVADGTVIGRYRVNYEDRSHADIPIVYGEDVRDWWFNDDAKGVSRGKVAWQGKNALSAQSDSRVRLYLGTWKNPHPEKSIASIDYSSTMTAACPFLVAITVER